MQHRALQGQKLGCMFLSDGKALRQYVRAPVSHCRTAFQHSVTFTSWNAGGGGIAFHVYSKEFTWDPTENQKPRIQRARIPVWYRLKDSGFKIQVDAWMDVSKKKKKEGRKKLKEQLSVTGPSDSWKEISKCWIFLCNCAFDTLDSRNQSQLF